MVQQRNNVLSVKQTSLTEGKLFQENLIKQHTLTAFNNDQL